MITSNSTANRIFPVTNIICVCTNLSQTTQSEVITYFMRFKILVRFKNSKCDKCNSFITLYGEKHLITSVSYMNMQYDHKMICNAVIFLILIFVIYKLYIVFLVLV